MAEFDTFECANCGESYRVNTSARAADTGYCSPACHTEGEGLA